jgi:hypothetical protein
VPGSEATTPQSEIEEKGRVTRSGGRKLSSVDDDDEEEEE